MSARGQRWENLHQPLPRKKHLQENWARAGATQEVAGEEQGFRMQSQVARAGNFSSFGSEGAGEKRNRGSAAVSGPSHSLGSLCGNRMGREGAVLDSKRSVMGMDVPIFKKPGRHLGRASGKS